MRNGTIVSLHLDKGFGFIHEQCGAPDLFFHAKSLIELTFDEMLKERRVQFDVIDTERGPRAQNVMAAK